MGDKANPFISDKTNYPQHHHGRKDHLWGWDDESIYYVTQYRASDTAETIRIQDHPELMHRIMNLCAEFIETSKATNKP